MKIQTPLYITPHHSHTEATAAFGALKALHGAYPALRFGMVYHPPRWLVFLGVGQSSRHIQRLQDFRPAATGGGFNVIEPIARLVFAGLSV